eukprot:2332957-Prymnesium_polylepis.1
MKRGAPARGGGACSRGGGVYRAAWSSSSCTPTLADAVAVAAFFARRALDFGTARSAPTAS